MQIWLRLVVDKILGRVPGKTSRLDTATRMAMDADFTGRNKPRCPEPHRKGERDDSKPLATSEDIALFQELVRIVNEAQGRDAEDERRLYGPVRVAGPSLRRGRMDPGSRFQASLECNRSVKRTRNQPALGSGLNQVHQMMTAASMTVAAKWAASLS
jgi:hypothetical protein